MVSTRVTIGATRGHGHDTCRLTKPTLLTRQFELSSHSASAGVGLRTNFREMRKQGVRPFIVGALGEVAIAAITLGLVVGADKIFTL